MAVIFPALTQTNRFFFFLFFFLFRTMDVVDFSITGFMIYIRRFPSSLDVYIGRWSAWLSPQSVDSLIARYLLSRMIRDPAKTISDFPPFIGCCS